MIKIFKKYSFEITVTIAYIILAFIFPQKTFTAFKEGIIIFMKMLSIFFCVTFFSSFIAIFLSPKTIKHYMGKETGFKGLVFGVIFGTLIVGPLWILFPLFKTFLEKGARLAVVGAMIGAFAIKTPWIPYAAGFMGWPFVTITIVLTFSYAIVEGILMEKILKHSN